MEENFNFEIISPEKIIFTGDVSMVTFPSYEGDMSILKNHISIITFLRPGIVKIYKEKNDSEEFFVQDGTVEHFNNSLVLLSASAISTKDLSKDFLDNLIKDVEEKLKNKDINDHECYILNHKLEVIKNIRA